MFLTYMAARATSLLATLPAADPTDPTDPTPSNPFDGWVGKPDPSWLSGMKTTVKGLSGMALGAAVLVGILVIAAGAVLIMLAGKSKESKSGGVRVVLNVLQGLGLILIGIPVIILLVGAAMRFWPS